MARAVGKLLYPGRLGRRSVSVYKNNKGYYYLDGDTEYLHGNTRWTTKNGRQMRGDKAMPGARARPAQSARARPAQRAGARPAQRARAPDPAHQRLMDFINRPSGNTHVVEIPPAPPPRPTPARAAVADAMSQIDELREQLSDNQYLIISNALQHAHRRGDGGRVPRQSDLCLAEDQS